MTVVIKFNHLKPVETVLKDCEFDPSEHFTHFKYCRVSDVYDHTEPLIRKIIDQVPIQNKHKNVLIDVKPQWLTPEKCSCIPGWHCDSVVDPTHDSLPEVHHLVTFGGSPTEFISGKISLKWETGYSLKSLQDQIPNDVNVFTTESGKLYTYGRFDFHRGVYAKEPHFRLLVRITETDVVKPNSIRKFLEKRVDKVSY